MELLTKALLDLATVAMAVLIPILVGFAADWMRRKAGEQSLRRIQTEIESKQDLAVAAVKFAQQAFKDLDGPEKYEEAAAWLADRAQSIGLTMTTMEIKGLIEAALKDLKYAFREAWKR